MKKEKEKQKLLLEYLISSPDTFAKCNTILNHEYFVPEYQDTVEYIKLYYEEYSNVPDVDQIKVDLGITLNKIEITKSKIDYCCKEIEQFCLYSAVEDAMVNGMKEVAKKGNNADYDQIVENLKKAVLVKLDDSLGVSFFDDAEEMTNKLDDDKRLIPLGYKELDFALYGGINRTEMLLIAGCSGHGKSLLMMNLALNLISQGYNGVFASLELSEDLVYERFINMTTRSEKKEWRLDKKNIVKKITSYKEGKRGELLIKKFHNGANANDFRAYLKEYELKDHGINGRPDFFVCDYVDLMKPIGKYDPSDVHGRDKMCTEEFGAIGHEYNLIPITASQLNRGAVNAQVRDHSHIAGGISKINTTDIYLSINMTKEMREAGNMDIYLEKTRSSSGVGKSMTLHQTPYLRILDPSNIDMSNINKNKEKKKEEQIEADNDFDYSGLKDLGVE